MHLVQTDRVDVDSSYDVSEKMGAGRWNSAENCKIGVVLVPQYGFRLLSD